MSIIEKLKVYGIEGAYSSFRRRFFKTSLNKAHYLRLIINPTTLKKQMEGFDLNVKELSFNDFLLGDPNVFRGNKMELYKQRFNDTTYKAYGIIDNGRLVYSTWISYYRMGMSVETKPIFLASNEGYFEDSYCAPSARGQGLHSKMNVFRIQKIYETGRDRVIAIVQDGNIPAFKVQLKCGFEEIGTFWQGHLLGFKINTLKKEKFDGK